VPLLHACHRQKSSQNRPFLPRSWSGLGVCLAAIYHDWRPRRVILTTARTCRAAGPRRGRAGRGAEAEAERSEVEAEAERVARPRHAEHCR
jgi:hypothetical protein